MELKQQAEAIFRAGVQRVEPQNLLKGVITIDQGTLKIKADKEELFVDLNAYEHIKLIGFGKAADTMAAELCKTLGDRLHSGLIIVKEDGGLSLPEPITVLKGSHPVPDESSLLAGKKLKEFCQSCGKKDLVLGVISGGASALMEVPAEGITLEDLKTTTEALLASGATIHEMNCVRKHLSLIKGGYLTKDLFPATSLNFVLSDVVGDDVSLIASGPTAPDKTTFKDAWKVIERFGLTASLPNSVLSHLKEAKIETPKTGDDVFRLTRNFLIGTNRLALMAARKKAQELGFDTLILGHDIQGEASVVAEKFYQFSKQVEINNTIKKPACILAGGETTVTLDHNGKGAGGRNQEMALAYLCLLKDDFRKPDNQIFLAASTDGGDGPTDAAGAFASLGILMAAKNLDPEDFLDRHDSYNFFRQCQGLLKTGATGTNVCDLYILLML